MNENIIYTRMCIVWNESARTGLHKSDAMGQERVAIEYFSSDHFIDQSIRT